jgi:hypothetical protein
VAINVLQKALFAKAGTTPVAASGADAPSAVEADEKRLEFVLHDARQRRVEGEANEAERCVTRADPSRSLTPIHTLQPGPAVSSTLRVGAVRPASDLSPRTRAVLNRMV